MKRLILIMCCVLASGACRKEQSARQNHTMAVALDADTETCAACGMVVREQPSPRGQVVYHDGTREFLCSIGDLLHFLAVPSPSGKPLAIYAEVMPDDHEADNRSTTWQVWGEAGELFFVTDIERAAVMGKPVLTFHTRKAAEKAANKLAGKVVNFDELRTKRQ
ncbi:MAG: nitrous oxide reductase accessory protein NosL [Verrucomicrobiales bacterium]|nr:nitrous oxide reductase accessory protein NosL [Verrucomicrobiales bacterium]